MEAHEGFLSRLDVLARVTGVDVLEHGLVILEPIIDVFVPVPPQSPSVGGVNGEVQSKVFLPQLRHSLQHGCTYPALDVLLLGYAHPQLHELVPYHPAIGVAWVPLV